MTTFARGLAASLVVSIALLAACTSGDDAAPTTSVRPPIASSKVTPRSTTTSTTSVAPTSSTSTSTTSTSTTSTSTTTPTTTVPSTTIALAPDQQATTADEVRALVGALPATAPDPEAATIAASIEGALARVADGTLSPADFFLAAGDYVPSGVVINPYLVCPLSWGEKCTATLDDYVTEMTKLCAGLAIQLSVVEGPLGPAGAGTCVWRPSPEQIEVATAVVREALTNALHDNVFGAFFPKQEVAQMAQLYADFHASHPYEDVQESDVAGAAEFRQALDAVDASSWTCRPLAFVDPVDDDDRAALLEGVQAQLGASVERWLVGGKEPRSSWVGFGAAIGSGRLVVSACAARP